MTSGTAPLSADDSDAFTAEIRNSGADLLCRNRIRRRRRGLDAGRPSEVLAGQTRQRGTRQPGGRTAGRRRRRRPTASRPDRSAGGQSRRNSGASADWIRTTDMARIDADGFSVDRRSGRPGDHSRRLQSHARRRARRPGKSPRGCRGCGRRAARRKVSAKRRWPWWNCGSRIGDAAALIDYLRTGWPATRFPPRSRSSPNSQNTVRQAGPGRDPAPFQRSSSRSARSMSNESANRRRSTPQASSQQGRSSAADLRRRARQLRRRRTAFRAVWPVALSLSAPARALMSDFCTPTASTSSSACWPQRGSALSSYRFPPSPPPANCASSSSTATPKSFSPRRRSDRTTTCNGWPRCCRARAFDSGDRLFNVAAPQLRHVIFDVSQIDGAPKASTKRCWPRWKTTSTAPIR